MTYDFRRRASGKLDMERPKRQERSSGHCDPAATENGFGEKKSRGYTEDAKNAVEYVCRTFCVTKDEKDVAEKEMVTRRPGGNHCFMGEIQRWVGKHEFKCSPEIVRHL
jgi:hypothetical protein